MKRIQFLTESKRKAIISEKEKIIIESFAKVFNKIKRIDENELTGDNTNIISQEVFNQENFKIKNWKIIKFDLGRDDSIVEINFTDINTEEGCFYLKAIFSFYYNITGEEREQTLTSPPEYLETTFDEKIEDIKYIECETNKEYKLTDEMKQKAMQEVSDKFEYIKEDIDIKIFDYLNDYGHYDGDDNYLF